MATAGRVKEAKEYRTVMYSVEQGEVVVHRLPFNAHNKWGLEKLGRYLQRGFTFDDPRKGKGTGMPEVLVTGRVEVARAVEEERQGSGMPEVEEEIKVSEAEIIGGVEEPEIAFIKCPECGKGCRSFAGLEAHMRKHRREKGELKPYKHGKKRKRVRK